MITDDALNAVANGTGMVLDELAFLLKRLPGTPKSSVIPWRNYASIRSTFGWFSSLLIYLVDCPDICKSYLKVGFTTSFNHQLG